MLSLAASLPPILFLSVCLSLFHYGDAISALKSRATVF